jgi:prenyltransferase beta subunit
MLIQLLKQRQKQHKLVIMADSSINFQFHYTVLGLLLHLVDCNAADLEDKSSFIRVSGSKRKYEESVVASMIASVSNDGGFSNSNDNVDHLNNNHNTIVLDTNCKHSADYKTDKKQRNKPQCIFTGCKSLVDITVHGSFCVKHGVKRATCAFGCRRFATNGTPFCKEHNFQYQLPTINLKTV